MSRPGPRSKKRESKILQKRWTLGESSSSDDESIDHTTSHTTVRRRDKSGDASFRTPEKENNATDYGLEFTTSNIQNLSLGRSSTLRVTSSRVQSKKSEKRTGNNSPSKQPSRQISGKEQEAEIRTQREQKDGNQETDESDSSNDEENSFERFEQRANMTLRGRKTQSPHQQYTGTQSRHQRASGKDNKEKGNAGHSKGNLVEDNIRNNPAARQHVEKPSTSKPGRPPGPKNRQIPIPVSAGAKKQPIIRKQLNPERRDRRFWREVKALQQRTDFLIPRLPFARFVREIIQQETREVTQITVTALEALQTATEMYVTQRLQDAYMLTMHRGRVTLEVRDLELLNFLKSFL